MALQIPTPAVTKQQFITYVGGALSTALAGLTLFDPSIHISASTKGLVATAATVVGGWLASVFVHSSHKLEGVKAQAAAGLSTATPVKVVQDAPNQ